PCLGRPWRAPVQGGGGEGQAPAARVPFAARKRAKSHPRLLAALVEKGLGDLPICGLRGLLHELATSSVADVQVRRPSRVKTEPVPLMCLGSSSSLSPCRFSALLCRRGEREWLSGWR